MAIEIERKFVVKKIPSDEIKYSHYIKQGYIISDMQKVIRVRQKKDDFFITIKGNKTGISRFEFEYKIPKKDADQLFKNFCTIFFRATCSIQEYLFYQSNCKQIKQIAKFKLSLKSKSDTYFRCENESPLL